MENFTVEVLANMEMNQGEKNYSQMYRAINSDNKCVAEHYDSNNQGSKYIFPVISKRFIKSDTGTYAIIKFLKWRNEGHDEDWLSSELT